LLHGFTVAFELDNDQLFQAEAKRKGNATLSPWLPSVLLGHEYLFGRLIFSQQIGFYAINTYGAYDMDWYHRWGFVFYPVKKIGFGTNFKIHGATANFVDARIVYQIL
jgi:hypothetical protein